LYAHTYDQIQIDSDIERRFVEFRLNEDDNIVCYFKFPSKFKINIPKIIPIESGNSIIIPFSIYFEIENNTRRELRKDLKYFFNAKTGLYYISDIMCVFYSNKRDFFGNTIDCGVNDEDLVNSYRPSVKSKVNDDPFYFIVETAKGSFFSKRVTWYSDLNSMPPFSRINPTIESPDLLN